MVKLLIEPSRLRSPLGFQTNHLVRQIANRELKKIRSSAWGEVCPNLHKSRAWDCFACGTHRANDVRVRFQRMPEAFNRISPTNTTYKRHVCVGEQVGPERIAAAASDLAVIVTSNNMSRIVAILRSHGKRENRPHAGSQGSTGRVLAITGHRRHCAFPYNRTRWHSADVRV